MAECIRIYNKTEIGYQKLNILANYMNVLSSNGTTYELENVYFDFSQDWVWTTVVAKQSDAFALYNSYQVLNPLEMVNLQNIKLDEDMFFNIYMLAYEIMNGKYSLDKPNHKPQKSEM